MSAVYDTIGVNYADLRKPDSRVAGVIWEALGAAETVLNVGAGGGSYEPGHLNVTALEPSSEMIRQRPAEAAPVIRGVAEDLPFDDSSFDAVMAVLTVHHWSDKAKGLAELRRVAKDRVVILTFDPAFTDFWLTDYIPELIRLDEGQMPPMADYGAALGDVTVSGVPVPHDCSDGFLSAYWRRPAAYLDERIRSAISSFWLIETIEDGLGDLRRDLGNGEWERKYGHLSGLDDLDCGYRLVVTA